MPRLTDEAIAEGCAAMRSRLSYWDRGKLVPPLHEHPDCVRIAYEWLDAQTKRKGTGNGSHPLKHMIESWGGRYVSQDDVEVAVHMHPGVRGSYRNCFNLSRRLVLPSLDRLEGIGEAGAHAHYRDSDYEYYHEEESPGGPLRRPEGRRR